LHDFPLTLKNIVTTFFGLNAAFSAGHRANPGRGYPIELTGSTEKIVRRAKANAGER
jgi:hypothetical protein